MHNVVKLASIVSICTFVLGSSISTAGAFQILEPAGKSDASSRQAASAFAEDGQGSANAGSSILSAREIKHITWCATKYGLGYDAVNNTYLSRGGINYECVSPR